MSAPAGRTLISRADFLASIGHAAQSGHGFATGKIGPSEQFLLYHPILEANYPDPRQRRAVQVAMGFHGERQTGIFPSDPAFYAEFVRFYGGQMAQLDALGLFGAPTEPAILDHYRLDVPLISFLNQEPGRAISDDPADCYLPGFAGKRILLISSFAPLLAARANAATFEAVWAKTGKRWFDPASVESLVMFYGWAPETQRRFPTSLDLLEHLSARMSQIDFDVALIGAGGLGIPLAVHAKALGKIGISLGGHLQVLFGVLGKRWRDRPDWQRDYITPAWTDLPDDFKPAGQTSIVADGGAYW